MPLAGRWKTVAQIVVTLGALTYLLQIIDINQVSLARFSVTPKLLALVFVLLSANVVLTTIRLRAVLLALGYRIPLIYVFNTHVISQLAGALFFQLVGQTLSRAAFLSKWGVNTAEALVISVTERIIVAAVSVALCIVGVVYLFGWFSPAVGVGPNYFVKCLLILLLACFFAARVSCRQYLKWVMANIFSHISPNQLANAGILTLCGQLIVSLAYVIASDELAGGTIPLPTLLCASFIIMFAAAIPISFAGWGVRELGAIWVLGAIGIAQEQATFVAVLIGIAALAVLCVPLLFTWILRRRLSGGVRDSSEITEQPSAPYRKAVLLGLPLICGIFVFFQLRLPVLGSEVSVNLADPVAITAGLLVLIELLKKRKLPVWHAPNLNKVLVGITLVLAVSLVIGVGHFGVTAWAVNNRFWGWFVLLAYLLTGGLAGRISGLCHRQAVVITLIVTGVTVAFSEWILMLLKVAAIVPIGTGWVKYNLEGLVQNRNAFAFQMLAVLSVMLSYRFSPGGKYVILILAVVVTIIIESWSRAGLITLAVILIIAFRRGAISLAKGGQVLAVAFAMQVVPYALAVFVQSEGPLGGGFSAYTSDVEHWQTIFAGLRMWAENPILGAGLGAFIHEWQIFHGVPFVIHSIYVWMLAETGIIGFSSFALLAFALLRLSIAKPVAPNGMNDHERTGLLLLLACMLFMGLFHDVLYQRIFWFTLGLLLAKPAPEKDYDAAF